MNYIDVYLARVNHFGSTPVEQAQNRGIHDFEEQLESSIHRVELSAERGLFFSGIILTNKEDENKKTMLLNVAVDIPLQIGDIINWPDGLKQEKWIVYQKKRKVNETYQTFYIVRCNYYIKWVDDDGHLCGSWCYLVSSMDDKIKGNYRTWHNLITPQPNKYMEMLIPERKITRGTRFVVDGECWKMIESDGSSVPGILYMSLTEEKLNFLNDDRELEIADTDRLANYRIVYPEEPQTFRVGDEINLNYTVMKDGVPNDAEVECISLNKAIVRNVDGVLTAVAAGPVDVQVRLKQFPNIYDTVSLVIGEVQTFTAYIDGQDAIKLNRSASYSFKSATALVGSIDFHIEETTELASIIGGSENSCVIKANAKNKLGSITLVARYQDKEYKKEIDIVPLW